MKLLSKLRVFLTVLFARALNFVMRFKLARRGISAASVVGAAIALLLVAYLFPIALLAIADANTTGWVSVVITIFQTVLPIMAVIGMALKFMPWGRK